MQKQRESNKKYKKESTKKLKHRDWVINLARCYPFLKLIVFALLFTIDLLYTFKHFDLTSFKSVSSILLLCLLWLPLSGAFKNSLVFIFCLLKVARHKKTLNPSKYVLTVSGTPGAGKTSSTLFDAICMARLMWFKLRYKHWLNMGLKKRILKSGDKNKIKEYYDVEEAYDYWKNHSAIPCFMSNTPVKSRGKYAVELTIDYLRQEKKVPYMCVLFFDEIGNELGNDKSSDKKNFVTISEFFRYVRHFGEFHIFSCEQDAGNVMKDCRRVNAENRYMKSQDILLKPTVLKYIFLMFENIFVFFNSERQAKKFAPFMYNFGKFINACGYRFYKYTSSSADGNTSSNAKVKSKKGSFVLPAPLNCEYDERSWRNEYKAKDKPLDLTIYESLIKEEQKVA